MRWLSEMEAVAATRDSRGDSDMALARVFISPLLAFGQLAPGHADCRSRRRTGRRCWVGARRPAPPAADDPIAVDPSHRALDRASNRTTGCCHRSPAARA